jgi:alpha-galactosidase
MAIGWSISDAYVREVADFLQSSGLQAAGYTGVFSDDGWSAHRGADGKIVPDPKRWPNGLNNITSFLHARNLTFGLYTSASGVACSGRPGSLYNEDVDAQSFASWEIDYIKIDSASHVDGVIPTGGC